MSLSSRVKGWLGPECRASEQVDGTLEDEDGPASDDDDDEGQELRGRLRVGVGVGLSGFQGGIKGRKQVDPGAKEPQEVVVLGLLK